MKPQPFYIRLTTLCPPPSYVPEPVTFQRIPLSVESWIPDPEAEKRGKDGDEEEEEVCATDDLYSRIHQLSEKIKSDLTLGKPGVVGDIMQSEGRGYPAAAADDRSLAPSQRVEVEDEKLQKALAKMAKLDARLLELVKVSPYWRLVGS